MGLTICRMWDEKKDKGLPCYFAETDRDGVHWFICGITLKMVKDAIRDFKVGKE